MWFDRDQPNWGSRTTYPDGTHLPFNLDKIVIHWGGNTDPDGPDDIATEAEETAILRGWQRYHIDSKGWTDIAYGFGFGNTGLVYRCRGFNRQGATSGDMDDDGIKENYEAMSFVWIGGTRGTPTDAAYTSMGRAIREILAAYPDAYVTVHSDHKATACPGDDWRAWVDRQGWLDEQEADDMWIRDIKDATWTQWYTDGHIQGDPDVMPDYYFADGPAQDFERVNAFNIAQQSMSRKPNVETVEVVKSVGAHTAT